MSLLASLAAINHFLNHAQSKVRVLLVATIPDCNIESVFVYPLSLIIDLFTFTFTFCVGEYAECGFDQQRLVWYVCRLWDMVFS